MAAGHDLSTAQRYPNQQRCESYTARQQTVRPETVLRRLPQMQEYASQDDRAMQEAASLSRKSRHSRERENPLFSGPTTGFRLRRGDDLSDYHSLGRAAGPRPRGTRLGQVRERIDGC